MIVTLLDIIACLGAVSMGAHAVAAQGLLDSLAVTEAQ